MSEGDVGEFQCLRQDYTKGHSSTMGEAGEFIITEKRLPRRPLDFLDIAPPTRPSTPLRADARVSMNSDAWLIQSR